MSSGLFTTYLVGGQTAKISTQRKLKMADIANAIHHLDQIITIATKPNKIAELCTAF